VVDDDNENDGNDGDGDGDGSNAFAFDSLFHIDPSRLLTPLERSVKAALNDIHNHQFSKGSGTVDKNEDSLNIFRAAGVKCGLKNKSKKEASRSMFHFCPNECRQGDGDGDGDIDVDGDGDGDGDGSSGDMIIDDDSLSAKATVHANIKSVDMKRDPITASEVFDIIRNIQDPEHPLALEQLNVVSEEHVVVHDATCNDNDENDDNGTDKPHCHYSTIDVRFTPTIPHCSMATLIGLCIRVKLLRSVPTRFKVIVRINPGTHASELAVNRQLNDKERVIAALENVHLLGVVNKCIANGMKGDDS